jgi:hypothetical protein
VIVARFVSPRAFGARGAVGRDEWQLSSTAMTDDELTRLFAFENDFGDRLACLPMAVRYKLDAAGIKLHLKEWTGLPDGQRRELLAWTCASEKDLSGFAERIKTLVEARTGRAPDVFAPVEHPEWLDGRRVPQAVHERAEALGITLSLVDWARLTPLQRFALVKLSRPKHDAQKLRPALEEFGVAARHPGVSS